MKVVVFIAVVAALMVLASAASMVRLETGANVKVPTEWQYLRKAVSSDMMKVQIAIKQSNVDVLEQKFWQVSNPGHADYGKYLSTNQIGELIAPPNARVERIQDWLKSAGVSEEAMELSLHRDLLSVRLNAEQAAQLFGTKLSVYGHRDSKRSVVRAEAYSVPETVSKDIDFVGGLLRFPTPVSAASLPKTERQTLASADHLPSKYVKEHESSKKQNTDYNVMWNSLGEKLRTKESAPMKSLVSQGDTYPRQSTLLNGDQWLLGDFLVRCVDGSVAYVNPTSASGSLVCPSTNVQGPVSVELVVKTQGDFYRNLTVGFENCEQFDPNDKTNLVSLNRAKLMKTLGLTWNGPLGRPAFCAIQMNNLPNFQRLDVNVRSLWTMAGRPSQTPFGTSMGQLATLWTAKKLRDFYGIPEAMALVSDNSQSVAEFLGEYYSSKDLSRWMSFMDVETQAGPVEVIGPNDEQNPGGEATLDIQWMLGIAPNARTVFWSLGDLHEGQEPFLEWLTDIHNTPNAPLVHSVSYADEETTLTMDYMSRINVELMKAGVRGISMLFASGDDGVLGYTARNATWPNCASMPFQPQFPSSSPFATSVGGTIERPNQKEAVATSDGAAARITSGGGFSNIWPQPAYQTAAVQSYLTTYNIVPNTKFNPSNRAYPDISGMAHNYLCLLDGAYIPIDGTSASTPLLASMITRINGQLLASGKPSIGFINPLIYQLVAKDPSIVNDITQGDNGCTASSACCVQGFKASPGWDPSTGLGTPKFDRLLNAVLQRLL